MTTKEFQKAHSGKLLEALNSQLWKDTLTMLNKMRPPYEMSPEPHLFAENRGAVRGYEQCLRTLISLATPPPVEKQAEADYGIKDVETKS